MKQVLVAVCAMLAVSAGCTNARTPESSTSPASSSRPSEPDAATPPRSEQKLQLDFESGAPGSVPANFSTDRTGDGDAGTWELQRAEGAPSGSMVLAQTNADDTSSRFPLCVYEPVRAKDVRATVGFRAVQGKVDQAAGLVVRYHDKDEYYIARANALEGNVRLYRIVGGKRTQFAGVSADVKSGTWHELGLEVVGTHFRVSYDGKTLFEADDSTIPGEGRVGLWTKADSITQFDDLVIETLGTR